MTSPTLLCSQQGHRHQPLMLNEGEGSVCEALRCLWMSKAWEAHSAGFCAPSEVRWRPPMDLHRAAADETPRRAPTGEAGLTRAGLRFCLWCHVCVTSQQWLLSSVTQRPDHFRSTLLRPIPCFRDDTVEIQLVFLLSTFTPNTGANWIFLLLSVLGHFSAAPRWRLSLFISPRSLFIPRTQTAVMFVVPGGSSVPRGCLLRAAAA